jgi:membrane protease YdiL (CAAX protease family)
MATTDPLSEPQPARDADRWKRRLRGFGPLGILFIVLVIAPGPFVGAILVLLWAWYTKTPWRDLGFVRPKSWVLTIIGGIVVGVALKTFMKAIVMPLIGAPSINPAYHYLEHNTPELPGTLLMVIFSAGIGEEIVWRGFGFERLGHLLGTSRRARLVAALITATLFGVAHYQSQHWMGVEQAFIVGLIMGSYFAITRNIWPLIFVHAAFDVFAVLVVYFGYESTLAHLVFE